MSKYLVILHDAQDSSLAGREELKLRLCESLHVSPPAVDRLLQALPVILRRDLQKDAAETYANKLERLGAVVEAIEQIDGVTTSILTEALPEHPEESAHTVTAAAGAPDESYSFGYDEDADAEISALESLLDEALHDGAVQKAAPTVEVPKAAPKPPAADELELTISFDETESPAAPSRASILKELMADTPAAHSHTEPVAAASHETEPAAESKISQGALAAAFARSERGEHIEESHDGPPEIPLKTRRNYGRIVIYLAAGAAFFFALPGIFSALGLKRVPGMVISFDVDQLLREQSSILGLEAPDSGKHQAVITGQWVGDIEEDGVKAHLRLTEIDNVLTLASLEVNTPQPPKLSMEEIAAGKPLPIWLRKLEAGNLRRMQPTVQPGTPLSFVGNGRAYLEDAKGSDRTLVEVEVNLTVPGDDVKDVKAGWRLRRSVDEKQSDSPNEISRVGGKDFRVFFRGKAQASRETTKPTTAKAVPHDNTKK